MKARGTVDRRGPSLHGHGVLGAREDALRPVGILPRIGTIAPGRLIEATGVAGAVGGGYRPKAAAERPRAGEFSGRSDADWQTAPTRGLRRGCTQVTGVGDRTWCFRPRWRGVGSRAVRGSHGLVTGLGAFVLVGAGPDLGLRALRVAYPRGPLWCLTEVGGYLWGLAVPGVRVGLSRFRGWSEGCARVRHELTGVGEYVRGLWAPLVRVGLVRCPRGARGVWPYLSDVGGYLAGLGVPCVRMGLKWFGPVCEGVARACIVVDRCRGRWSGFRVAWAEWDLG